MRVLDTLPFIVIVSLAGCSPAVGDPPEPKPHTSSDHGSEVQLGSQDLEGFTESDGYAISELMPAELGAERGGFMLDLWGDAGDAPIAIEVRGQREDGSFTAWVSAEITWREAPHVVGRADLGERVPFTQFRLPAGQRHLIQYLTYAGVIPEPEAGDGDSDGIAQTQAALRSELSGSVEPRSAWKARGSSCSSNPGKDRIAIHHTQTPFSSSGSFEARLRAIQAYHMDTRGWCDIGYHFLVSQDGRVWEGRPLDRLGAHVANHNTGNVGVSYMGCFQPGAACKDYVSSTVPPQAMIEGGAKIVRQIATLYGISINASNVKGHGDHSGASTDCPGDDLEQRLGDIRALALNPGSTPPPPPGQPPPGTSVGWAMGVVWDLDSSSSPSAGGATRLDAATLSVDGGSPVAVRSGDAFWKLELPSGTHSVTASAAGYASKTTSVSVVAGADTWASIGLLPAALPVPVDVNVTGAGAPLAGAIVYLPDASIAKVTGSDGRAHFELAPGSTPINVYHSGYAASGGTLTVQGASSQSLDVALNAVAPPASTGALQGVVWDASKATSVAASSNARVETAIVISSSGHASQVRSGDAYFRIDAPPGSYTFTVLAPGFQSAVSNHSLSSGAADWGSVGLSPVP